ncbi:hypothetical protein ABZX90_33925 [Streptomyces sp. NPDC002935]
MSETPDATISETPDATISETPDDTMSERIRRRGGSAAPESR